MTWPFAELAKAEKGISKRFTYQRLLGGDKETLTKINFTVEENGQEVVISEIQYRAVAEAIADGKIAEADVSEIKDGLPRLGGYQMGSNTLYTSAHSVSDRSVLLHEMTHAIIDMHKADRWTKATDEATAFLAQAAFLAHKNAPVPVRDALETAVLETAFKIIRSSGIGNGSLASKVNQHPEWVPLKNVVTKYYQKTGGWLLSNGKYLTGDENAGADGL